MGNPSRWYGFPPPMQGLWASDYDTEKTGGEEY